MNFRRHMLICITAVNLYEILTPALQQYIHEQYIKNSTWLHNTIRVVSI